MKNKILSSATILGILIILVNIGVYTTTACAGYKECPVLPIPTDEYIASPSATMTPVCMPNDEWDRIDCITPDVTESPTTVVESPISTVVPTETPKPTEEIKEVSPTPTTAVQVPMTGRAK